MISTVRSLVALASTLAATSSVASAQPGAGLPPPAGAPPPDAVLVTPVVVPPSAPLPPAPAAPQNEDWSDVSHINGQIVRVGERGEYLYRWKTTSIATNPIGWMFGFYGLSISHAVHENAAIRADANLISLDDTRGYEVGLSVPIYFRRVFSGPFLELGAVARSMSDSCDGCVATSLGPEVLLGWHWTFDSGFNLAIALGAIRDVNGHDSSVEAEPAGYFRIGYAL